MRWKLLEYMFCCNIKFVDKRLSVFRVVTILTTKNTLKKTEPNTINSF
jgi:hypothetical protein